MSFYNKPFPQMTQFTCASTLALSTIVLESAISPLIAQPKNEERSRYVCYIENEEKKEQTFGRLPQVCSLQLRHNRSCSISASFICLHQIIKLKNTHEKLHTPD